jgi:hypothetical protein
MVDPEILKEDDERDRLNEAFYDENVDDDDEEDPHVVWTTETRQEERGLLGMRMMFAREEDEDSDASWMNGRGRREDEEDSDASWMNSDEDPDDSSSEDDDEEAAARASREPMNRLAIDSIIERENRSSRENYIPSPQEVTSFLEQSGYSLIDFVRIVLWNEHHQEYDAIIAQRIYRSTSRRVFHFIRGLLREYQGRIETNTNTNITHSDEEETNAEEVNEPQDSSWLTAQTEPFDDTGFFFMGSTASIDDEEDTPPPPEWIRTRFQLDLD